MFLNCGVGKTLESALDCKEIQPVHPKGDQSWMFIGRTDAEAEAPILWPPDLKNWLIGKDPDAGKDWRWEEMGMTEDEMAECHRWLKGQEFESTLGVGDGQGGLACCDSWGRKELDMTEQLNLTELKFLGEFSCEAVWTWAFVCWKISDYTFNFCSCDGSIKILNFFLVQFWKVVLF